MSNDETSPDAALAAALAAAIGEDNVHNDGVSRHLAARDASIFANGLPGRCVFLVPARMCLRASRSPRATGAASSRGVREPGLPAGPFHSMHRLWCR